MNKALVKSEILRLNEIIDHFNFDKVHGCMSLMKWRWAFAKTESGIPSKEEIIHTAKDLITKTIVNFLRTNNSGGVGIGGFNCYYHREEDYLELSFVVADWDDSEITETEEYLNCLNIEKRSGKIDKVLKNDN